LTPQTSRSWTRSRALLEKARQSLAGGVSSPFRAKFPVPLYFSGGRGARLTDVDGNEYIDYVLAWGPMILGYAHPAVVGAVRRAAEGPHCFGQQHELEIEVAEKICAAVPCAERVAFTSSGSEAVQLALRLARAHTKRPLILKFEGHYHGWMDSTLWSYHPRRDQVGPAESPCAVAGSAGQVPNAADNLLVAPWNHIKVLEAIFHTRGPEIAGVIMEPVLCNSGNLLPAPGYLEGVRDLCRHHGALLIFDEVITGFRIALGGAQSFYSVTPDIATFGKAVAGGLPLSVVAGRGEILDRMFSGGVAFGGTFNGNPLSMAAANATLSELASDNGALLAQANKLGRDLMCRLGDAGRRHRVPLQLTGFGAAFSMHFTERSDLRDYRDTLDDDAALLQRVLAAALAEGIHLIPDGRWYVSAAHTPRDIEETVAAFDRALSAVAATP
jgi:glutamate-1-semialdehyde 2,1-aminomutase